MSDTRTRTAPLVPAVSLILALYCTNATAQQAPAAADAAAPAAPAAPAERTVTINEYIVRGNTVLDGRAIERAVTPFLGPSRTLADVESARAALQAAYQEHGYQSIYVDLPEQQVTGGVVLLQVAETRVGQVAVTGARHNDPEKLRERVPALQAGVVPDFAKAQEQLTALNRGGKRQVIPLVKQGTTEGTMDVELKVEDQSPWRFNASVNNDHSTDTDPLRTVLSVGNDNLWQREHSASLTWFAAPEDLDQASVISASYALPLGTPDWMLEFSGYTSDSNVLTAGETSVTGKGHSFGAKISHTLPMTGAWWHQLSLGVSFNDRSEEVGMVDQKAQTVPLKYAPVTFAYSGFRQGERHLVSSGVSLVFGTRSLFGYGSDAAAFDWARYKADPSFFVLKADLGDTLIFGTGMQLASRISVQHTDRPLTSGEQFAAGGLYTVRGYRSAEAIGDIGAQGSVELRTRAFSLPGVQDWRIYTYFDGAWLKLKEPLPEQEDEFKLGSVGLGTSLRMFDTLNVRLDYGYPLTDGPTTTQGAHRLHFSIGAGF